MKSMYDLKKKLDDNSRKSPKGCILWTGYTESGGYGNFVFEGLIYRAHRLSYEIHKGPIPTGRLVCHTCDVRRCINPDHLFIGTHKDNTRDCLKKGRFSFNDIKLTLEEVKEIKNLYNTGKWTHRSLAEKFGVVKTTIWDILNSNHWNKEKTKVKFSRIREKITFEIAEEIRQKYKTGKYFQRKLAKEYGLCQQQICDIVNGKYWKHPSTP